MVCTITLACIMNDFIVFSPVLPHVPPKAVDELNKKDFALKMVRIPRGRSGQLANEKVS